MATVMSDKIITNIFNTFSNAFFYIWFCFVKVSSIFIIMWLVRKTNEVSSHMFIIVFISGKNI